MMKLFYGAALLVVAAGSFAFLPKDTAPKHGVLLFSYFKSESGVGDACVRFITKEAVRPVTVKLRGTRQERITALHQLQAAQLDSLATDGWRLVTSHTVTIGVYVDENLMLEKP